MAQNENQKIALQLPNGLGITGSSSPRRPINPNPSGHSGIIVFSGGSAANNLVDVFETVREANQGRLSYVIPISDNGGSSSEVIRVFGGPGSFNLQIPGAEDPVVGSWLMQDRHWRCKVSIGSTDSQ